MKPLLASDLDDKLRQFRQAQCELYHYLDVDRQEPHKLKSSVRAKRYNHSRGLVDIPSPYPEVLDYRASQWVIIKSVGGEKHEIHVKIKYQQDWEASNIIRFHLYSIWHGEEDPYTHAVGTHLLKPHELLAAHPAEVSKVAGRLFLGDRCLLLLDPRNGSTEITAYQAYVEQLAGKSNLFE